MTTARTVPVTTRMDGEELDAEDAWHTVRRVGVRRLVVDSFVRFRYGDGFSSSRALALQGHWPWCRSCSPSPSRRRHRRGEAGAVLAAVIDAISPGSGNGDAMVSAVSGSRTSEQAGEVALWFGLVFALFSMTTAMAQVRARHQPDLRHQARPPGDVQVRPRRGDDRAARRPGRPGLPAARGRQRLRPTRWPREYGWGDSLTDAFDWVRWPLGIALLVLTIAVVLDHAPRRRQPGLSWLALGSGIAVLLNLLTTAALAL